MSQARYTKDHEYVSVDAGIGVVGVSDHAQAQLGDVVFVELPDPGRNVEEAEACAVVESVKAASDVYAPLAGKITETNPAITEDPALVNREPAGEGWFFKMTLSNPAAFAALLDADAYAKFVEEA